MDLKRKLSRLAAPPSPTTRAEPEVTSTRTVAPSIESLDDTARDDGTIAGASTGIGPEARVEYEPGFVPRARAATDARAPIDRSLPASARVTELRGLLSNLEQRTQARAQRQREAWPPRETPAPLTARFELETIETARGALRRRVLVLPIDHHHGRCAVRRACDVDARSLAALALDESAADFDPRTILYLDTETTGLSGGTGTLPFLIGMAWFEDDALRVEQLVLPRPGDEGPMLERLRERLAWASAVATYNGKSFDWPLLRTRAVMNRVPLPPPRIHLDLLHAAKRVFLPRLESARLVQMETDVLGFRREGDIDGAEIPQRFWDFVRSADRRHIDPVIEHNTHDLVALAALIATLAERWERIEPHHEPEDRLAVAKVAYRYGDDPRAMRFAESAAEAGGSRKTTREALVLGATVARRGKDGDRQRDLLLQALTHARTSERAAIHHELSKVFEHRVKDLASALEHAILSDEHEAPEALARRIERLRTKLARNATLPSEPIRDETT